MTEGVSDAIEMRRIKDRGADSDRHRRESGWKGEGADEPDT